MNICDIMTDRVVSIEQNEPVSAAAKLLKSCNVGALPVCDDKGRLRGMLTDRDIVLRCVAADADPRQTRVSEIMSRGIITASPFDGVDKAVKLMSADQVRRLPVMDDGRLVGMVTLCDMARSCNCEMEASEALTEISSNFKRR
jgi:CBS domain-containing protein